VNTNFAPILSVYRRQTDDFLEHTERSYGNTSGLVGTCASAFINNQQAAGVIATAKHFPGLGAAPTQFNTNEEFVTIKVSLDELRSIDEAPYVRAIAAKTDMIMKSWAIYSLTGSYILCQYCKSLFCDFTVSACSLVDSRWKEQFKRDNQSMTADLRFVMMTV
jgi:hypothetical protein